jgi:hypothetical protein
MSTVALPSSIEYGCIEGQIIQTAIDSNDPGESPDGRGVQGTVTLTPLDGQGEVIEGVFVFFRAFVVTLSAEGQIQVNNSPRVFLPVGNWRAVFALQGGVSLPDKTFLLTTDHDGSNPLNIITSIPPIGTPVAPSGYSIVALTQAQYDALTPDPATVYIITA